jgi:hypothetical protein
MECVLGQWAVRNAVERKEERLLPGVRGQNHTLQSYTCSCMNRPSVSGTAVMAIRAELLGHACRLFCAMILQSNIVALDIYSILAYDLL